MINYQDSLFLQINTPLDAKLCNYYRDGSDFIIEPIAKYLVRTLSVYRVPGAIVTVLLPKDGYTPTLDGNGLIVFPLASFETELDNFDIKYYTFEDGLQDIDFVEIDFGYTYVAFASDNTGTGFSLTPAGGLDYIGVLVSAVKLDTLDASNFTGLWHIPAIPAGQIQVD